MVVIIKKRLLIIVGAVLAFLAFAAGSTAFVAAYIISPPELVVVIDAGHGGIDAGVIGVNSRVRESEINLLLAQKVKSMLTKNKIKVVMTRTTEDGLYGNLEGKFKLRDMQKRKEIILASKPNLVVSLHCNKFPESYRRGAQVFFDKKSENSQILAKLLQLNLNLLNAKNVGREFPALSGDYYILKCSPYPSVIVECGFLSNAEDDALLNNPNYQELLSQSIVSGIMGYLLNIG